ncbi:hypothetical protein DERP_012435 [Dermatophagoides pteronyssinus]|uniref:Uncharacterized protein n=1 Tax=Dermatophagoides pteronyssinus TaxID=6956 RepID=A0ABQ8IWZ8_DERPT|nr:hypothetical protein DERP_012435 [Dermatophagoides pteronyssinus]
MPKYRGSIYYFEDSIGFSLSFRLPLNLKYHFNKTIESYWNHKMAKPGSIIHIDAWSINRRIEGIGYDYRIGLNHSIANGIKLRWPPILETIIRKRRPNLLIYGLKQANNVAKTCIKPTIIVESDGEIDSNLERSKIDIPPPPPKALPLSFESCSIR